MAYTKEDAAATAKVVTEFAKDHPTRDHRGHDRRSVLIDAKGIDALAKLPAKTSCEPSCLVRCPAFRRTSSVFSLRHSTRLSWVCFRRVGRNSLANSSPTVWGSNEFERYVRTNRYTGENNGRPQYLDQVKEYLGGLTVLELADLVKSLEEEWGVSAAAPVAVAVGGGGGGGDAGGRCRREDRVRRRSARLATRRSLPSRPSARSLVWASRTPRPWSMVLQSPSKRASPRMMLQAIEEKIKEAGGSVEVK